MHTRVTNLIIVFAVLFIGISSKAFYEQIINGPKYAQMSLSSRIIDFPGEEYVRGDILDCHNVSLTDTRTETNIVVFPQLIKEHDVLLKKIKKEIPEIYPKFTNLKPYYRNHIKIYPDPFTIKTNEEDIIDTISAWDEKGIMTLPVKTRYGEYSTATNIVGCLGYKDKGTYREGLLGIEQKWEKKLRGEKAEEIISPIMDGRGNLLEGLGFRNIMIEKDKKRVDVVLTIDSQIQRVAEEALDKYNVIKGSVVVLNIENGDILAAASRPALDQKKPNFTDQKERVIDYKVYPGSVFKVLTAAAILEEGLVTPDSTFDCTGESSLSHVTCPREHGHLTMTEAMARSCNTTFVHYGLQLGPNKLKEYIIDKFGIKPVKGKALNSNNARANGIIGQEIFKTSPLEIANIMATIARNGSHQDIEDVWNKRLIKGLITSEGYENLSKKPIFTKIYSDTTARELKNMLAETNKNGSGKRAWIEEYGSAGKTGTPQTDKADEYLAWYAGYAPLENPKWAIAVLIEEKESKSKEELQGGRDAGPIFKHIIDTILKFEK
ncbi:penicillin-binding protein 2 [Desulfonispora thiosulfatigenes DSM 11270]|uniref:Penicillin-binding protein 2 n=1 Tax=Desulfonispora thiosulfatigenes DSM 11270 TaxID=656914 RepID=A0A1W1VQT0_DESTI|nr:penicillin-binding protein 2 [Desulfonispora thiosulfatigenes]SMB95580.1 penicillin-binding protein 2 [Desulfonispora thiosulfatigenes DSM 11270]